MLCIVGWQGQRFSSFPRLRFYRLQRSFCRMLHFITSDGSLQPKSNTEASLPIGQHFNRCGYNYPTPTFVSTVSAVYVFNKPRCVFLFICINRQWTVSETTLCNYQGLPNSGWLWQDEFNYFYWLVNEVFSPILRMLSKIPGCATTLKRWRIEYCSERSSTEHKLIPRIHNQMIELWEEIQSRII